MLLAKKGWNLQGVLTIPGKQYVRKGHSRKRSASHSSTTVLPRHEKIIGKSGTYVVGILFLRVYFYINLPSTLISGNFSNERPQSSSTGPKFAFARPYRCETVIGVKIHLSRRRLWWKVLKTVAVT